MRIIRILVNRILNTKQIEYNNLEQWFNEKGESTDTKTFNKQDKKSRKLRKQIDFLRRFV
jgi:hypothetical protein